MKRTIVQYRVKPEHADRNEELVRAVFDELREKAPDGIGYATYRLEDGVSFVHVALEDGGSIADTEAFGKFREGLAERCEVAPVATGATEIGSYLSR